MEIFKLKEALSKLEEQTQQLCLDLNGAEAICAATPGPFLNGDRALSLITERFTNIWCDDYQKDARETPIGIGAAGSSLQAISLALEINKTKDDLKNMLIQIREMSCSKGHSRSGHDKAFRRLLSEIGLGRLSLRMVNRHIPVLNQTPKKIDFSFSTKGKSITRLTAEQALSLLEKSGMEGSHIEIQMKKLQMLPSQYPLAQVQHLAGYYKANVRYHDGTRRTSPVFLPILYPAGNGKVILPEELCGVKRTLRPRKDASLNHEAYIPSLRIYLYKDLPHVSQ